MLRLAAADYDPQPYPGQVALFHCGKAKMGFDPNLPYGWREVLNCEPRVYEVPGDHMTMLSEPHVDVLAKMLRKCLVEACEAATAQIRSPR
jgi:thioesterase domain-containing protein